MTDIVERLREKMTRDEFFKVANNLCFEAAAEIERLRLSLSEARATGRREGMEEAAKIADDMPILQQVTEKHIRSNKPKDVAAAIRAAMEKEAGRAALKEMGE